MTTRHDPQGGIPDRLSTAHGYASRRPLPSCRYLVPMLQNVLEEQIEVALLSGVTFIPIEQAIEPLEGLP